MFLDLIFVVQATFSSLSACSQNRDLYELSGRVRRIIQDEIVTTKEERSGRRVGDDPYRLNHSYFMDPHGDWVDSACDYYWDEKWEHFNCYAYAMQRYDVLPSYYPPCIYDPDPVSRWYVTGQISSLENAGLIMTAREHAEAAVADFNILGYRNVSAFKFNGVLPSLGEDEELIAIRITEPPGSYDWHFMRYEKTDGCWYHKPGYGPILKYKYPLSEQSVWSDEHPHNSLYVWNETIYSSEIWLVKYTPPVLGLSFGSTINTAFYLDNVGDRVVVLDIPASGLLDLSFANINGFSAVLYTNEWDAIDATTYGPISANVRAGRHYLVMKNYRYRDNVYVTASLSAVRSDSIWKAPGEALVIADDDKLIALRAAGNSSVEMAVMPVFAQDADVWCSSEVGRYEEK